MDKDFIKSVDDGDVKSVRLDLTNELLLDPRGETFKEMLTYAKEKMHNLFEENKEANYNVPPKEEWNESFLFKVKNDLDSNFSIEKLAFYQAVIEEVGKDKAKALDKEEEEHTNHCETQSQTQPSNKIVVKPVSATIATGGAVLTIVGVCLGKTLLSILGGAVLIGGVLLIINDNKR